MNLRSITTITLASFSMQIISCAPNTSRVYKTHYPPRNQESVKIIYSIPKKPYTLIADFQTMQSMDAIKKKAAGYGADAVYVNSITQSTLYSGAELSNKTQSSGINRRYYCSAIKYKN
jgi:hypothetical protein